MIRRPIKRQRDGSFTLSLPEHQRALLRNLAPDLRSVLTMGDQAETGRLFPVVHTADEEAEAKYQELVRDQLLESHLAALDVLEERADAQTLTEDELTSWMQAVNSLRLVMGTRLGVAEDDDWDLDPAAPDTPARATYTYLSWLLEKIVAALHDTLPDPE